MDKLKILHIIKDDKFFDSVYNKFEAVKQLENICVLLVDNVEDYHFRYIESKNNVRLVESKCFIKILRDGFYDVIFFHSLPADRYKYICYIPKDKIVIWWGWGYDIYDSVYGMEPLLNVNLYKPLTLSILNNKKGLFSHIKKFIKKIFFSRYYTTLRQKVIGRIDYFQPVIPLEYQLLRQLPRFKAKEFYYPLSFTSYVHIRTDYSKDINGGILIGNSQAPSNNHFDVWNEVKQYIPEGRSITFPINYIGDQDYANEISQNIQSKSHNLHFIRDFMPQKEYFEMVDNCSYAIFGVMRQQAMGNINHCLSHGLKVFLYRDSIVYRFLKEYGYVVFAIEEIDDRSFTIPLTKEEMEQNANAFLKEYSYIKDIGATALEDFCEIATRK